MVMGVYTEYLDKKLSFEELTAERKNQLKKVSKLRGGRDLLVYAADLKKGRAPISINYEDLLPINDQLDNLSGNALDLILESPGGSGEIAEDIVRLLRGKYEDIAVIVPGCAKSAATIMAMAADDILMESASSLGPIDAQLSWQGKVFSADALLEGMEKIKQEVTETGTLNKAYIPILQGISPGELQSAENALNFAKVLVTEWLAIYKFKRWPVHKSTNIPVSDADRRKRAEEIAGDLCDHGKWLTHGRSIKIPDLRGMKLQITDYSQESKLADAIRRYYTLLEMTFATNVYKVFETVDSQIYRFIAQPTPTPQKQPGNVAIIDVHCNKCGVDSKVQANLGKKYPLQEGAIPFPKGNSFVCPNCAAESDLSDLRRQLEMQTKKKVVE